MYAPAGCARRLAGFFGKADPAFLEGVFAFEALYDGHEARLGGLLLSGRAVVHDIEAYGLRAECDGVVLAYSGDSGPCAALGRLVRGADLLLCEADIDRHRERERQGVHLTPEDAGALARAAGVRELLITHVGPTLTPESATERAAAVFGGPAMAAREGNAHVIGGGCIIHA